MPVSTAPGPSSTKRSTPAARSASSVSRQRTGRSRFSASSRADVGERRGGAVGPHGEAGRRSASRRARRAGGRPPAPSAASGTRRRRRASSPRAPARRARAPRRCRPLDRAARARPARERCRWRPSGRGCARARATAWESPPSIATIPPGCAAAASCIAAARSSTRRSASSNVSAPAACSAAYSPSECPAAATSWPLGLRARPRHTRRPGRSRAAAPGSPCRDLRTGRTPGARARVRTAACRATWRPCPPRGCPAQGKGARSQPCTSSHTKKPAALPRFDRPAAKCRTDERCRSRFRSAFAADKPAHAQDFQPSPRRAPRGRLRPHLARAGACVGRRVLEALDAQLRGARASVRARTPAPCARPTRSARTSRTSPTRPPRTCTCTTATSRRRTAWPATSARSRRRTPRTSACWPRTPRPRRSGAPTTPTSHA